MKVTGPQGHPQIQNGKIRSKKEVASPAAFDNALKDAMGRPDQSLGIKKNSNLSEPRSVHSAGTPAFQTGYVDKTSRVIELMDLYSKALSNPRKTLRDIEPDLMRFISEAQSLHEEYVNSGNADTELKSIMEDLLRAARLEGARFQRGDYLDSE